MLLTGIFPVDYDPKSDKAIGIPVENTYAFYYTTTSETFPFIFTLIDHIIRYNQQTVYLFFVEESVESFYSYLTKTVEENHRRRFFKYMAMKKLFFLDATESDVEKVKNAIEKIEPEAVKEVETSPLTLFKRVRNLTNVSEVVFYIDRFIKLKEKYSEIIKGPAIIFLSYSGLVSRIGFDRAFKVLTYLVSKYSWTTGKETTLLLFMDAKAFRKDELNRVKSLLDGEIVLDSRDVFGHVVNYIRVLRLPMRTSYISEWVPYIIFKRYPPGVIYNRIEFANYAIRNHKRALQESREKKKESQ